MKRVTGCKVLWHGGQRASARRLFRQALAGAALPAPAHAREPRALDLHAYTAPCALCAVAEAPAGDLLLDIGQVRPLQHCVTVFTIYTPATAV